MPEENPIGGGLSEQDLKLANFWIRHGSTLRRVGYGSLIVFIALTWGYVLWTVLDTYVISYPRESLIPQRIATDNLTQASMDAVAPQPVQKSDILVFANTDNRQDFLVELTNPNPEWWADFSYHFESGDEKTPIRTSYLLPQDKQTLTELGWKGKGLVSSAQLVVEDVHWHRVIPSLVENDYAAFAKKRNQIAATDITYQNDLKVGDKAVGQTNFNLTNPTGYGFWTVDVTVILYRVETPVAVTKVTVRELKPGETRPMSINWFENIGNVSRTEVRTNVNLMDPNAFLPTNRF